MQRRHRVDLVPQGVGNLVGVEYVKVARLTSVGEQAAVIRYACAVLHGDGSVLDVDVEAGLAEEEGELLVLGEEACACVCWGLLSLLFVLVW